MSSSDDGELDHSGSTIEDLKMLAASIRRAAAYYAEEFQRAPDKALYAIGHAFILSASSTTSRKHFFTMFWSGSISCAKREYDDLIVF